MRTRIWSTVLDDAGCEFGRVAQEPMNPILSFVLSWVLPLLIFWGLGQLLGKAAHEEDGRRRRRRKSVQCSSGRAMQKSMCSPPQGITFNDVAGEDEAKELLTEIR